MIQRSYFSANTTIGKSGDVGGKKIIDGKVKRRENLSCFFFQDLGEELAFYVLHNEENLINIIYNIDKHDK